MRWGFRRGGEAHAKPAEWAARLGAQLDGQRMPLNGVAVSVSGAEVSVNATGTYTGWSNHGWGPVSFRFNRLEAAAGASGGEWSRRLQALGQLLDRDPRPVCDPCLVQLGNGFLITAIVAEAIAGVEQWEMATWRTEAER